MVFRAKKDKSVIGMLLVLPILSTIVSSIFLKTDIVSSVFLLALCYALSGLIILAIGSVKYIVQDDRLMISCVGVKRSILFEDIERVSEQNKPLTIEAPSAPQVCITRKNKTAIKIAPENREEFIRTLSEKVRQI